MRSSYQSIFLSWCPNKNQAPPFFVESFIERCKTVGLYRNTYHSYRKASNRSLPFFVIVDKNLVKFDLGISTSFSDSKDSDVCERIWSPKSCSSSIVRYSFNPDTQTCQSIDYNGCLGNANNFATPEECAKACVPGVFYC